MIEIIELTKKYDDLLALDKLSLIVSEKSICGIVGPNGAGKSTTLNILTGIILPTDGKVKILDLDLGSDSNKIKKLVGVIPEVLALFDGLTAEEHLTFVGKVYGLEKDTAEKRIKELLNYFDLFSAKDRLIDTFSMGMRKKLAFASAIIHSPKILFLDEPFENVDPTFRKRMKEILVKLRDGGTAIIITSHSLVEVEDFCDEVAIINKGKLVYHSKTTEIRKKIKDEVSKETYKSLEEIFVALVQGQEEKVKTLSWI